MGARRRHDRVAGPSMRGSTFMRGSMGRWYSRCADGATTRKGGVSGSIEMHYSRNSFDSSAATMPNGLATLSQQVKEKICD